MKFLNPYIFFISVLSISTTKATPYWKEDKYCDFNYNQGLISLPLFADTPPSFSDPLEYNLVPYTGFKVFHIFNNGLRIGYNKGIKLVHCTLGEVDKEEMIATEYFDPVPWNKPIFVYQPGKNLNSFYDLFAKLFTKERYNIDFNRDVRRVIKAKLEEKTVSSRILYESSLKDKTFDLNDFMKDFTKIKMVRRKKFLKRKLPIFLPHQWVGGLFECPKPTQEYLSTIPPIAEDAIKYLNDYPCPNELAIPLRPLIADNMFTFEEVSYPNDHILDMEIISAAPLLYTPDPSIDLRFRELTRKHWAKQLDINENYNFTKEDDTIFEKYNNELFKFIQFIIPEINYELLFKMINLEFENFKSLFKKFNHNYKINDHELQSKLLNFTKKEFKILSGIPESELDYKHDYNNANYIDLEPSVTMIDEAKQNIKKYIGLRKQKKVHNHKSDQKL